MIKWEAGEKIESGFTKNGEYLPDIWEVVEEGVIKVIKCSPYLSTYLDVGKTYNLDKHQPQSYLQLWEMNVEQTKRPDSCSQLLLFDWNDGINDKPSIEIDS